VLSVTTARSRATVLSKCARSIQRLKWIRGSADVRGVKEKPAWPLGEKSPWAGQQDPPTVAEVALAYPGRTLGNAFGGAILALLPTAFVMWAIDRSASAVFGVVPFTSVAPAFVLWPFMTAGCCWGLLYGEIRGWWTSEWGD
jgi:hypothetical protein